MIDTIHLQITDFSVSDGAPLEIQPGFVHGETGEHMGEFPLWVGDDGEWVRARSARLNTEQFSVDIKALGSGASCFVNIPSVAQCCDGGLGLVAVGRCQAISFFDDLGRQLSDMGIHVDLGSAGITRLDTFRDVETEFPFAAYRPVLEHLQPNRTKCKSDYGSTFYWGNKQQQITVYDKKAQLQARGANVGGLPDHLMRFELRFTKKKKIRAQLGGIDTLGDLLDQFDILPEVFNRTMGEQLFRHPVPDRPCASSLVDELEFYRQTGGRNWQQRYLADQGLLRRHEQGGLRAFEEALVEVTGDRRKAKRTLERGFGAQLNAPTGGPAIGELYAELKTKVTASEVLDIDNRRQSTHPLKECTPGVLLAFPSEEDLSLSRGPPGIEDGTE